MATLLSLLGVDGAGKTTQAKLLASWLEQQGRDVALLVNDSLQPCRAMLDRVAQRRGFTDHMDLLGPDTARLVAATLRWKSLQPLHELLRTPGRIVMTDRYVDCQYAVVRLYGGSNEAMLRDILSEFPTPDMRLYLNVSPVEAERRIKRRGLGENEPEELLRRFDYCYRTLPEFSTYRIVDANGSPEQVQDELRSHVSALLAEPHCSSDRE